MQRRPKMPPSLHVEASLDPTNVVDPLDPEHPDFENLIAQYKQAFAVFDNDSSGTITSSEVGVVMRALGQSPTEAELESMIKEIDSSNDGVLDFDEFCICMAKAKGAPPAGASQAPALAVIVNENGLLGDIKNFFVKDRGIKTFFASLRGPSAEEIAAAKAAAEAAAVAKAEAAAAAEAADVVRQAEMTGLANEMASRILEDAMAMAEKDQKEAQEAQEAAVAAAAASTLASSPRPQGGTVLAKALGASSKLTSLTFSPRGGKTPQGPVAAAPVVATPVAAT